MKRGIFLQTLLGLPFGIGSLTAKKLQTSEPEDAYLINKFYVAGFQYYEGPSFIEDIQPGETLKLDADPANQYDKFAVTISRGEILLGHVPRSDNKHISRLLQQNVSLDCKVAQANPNRETWKMLKVNIYL